MSDDLGIPAKPGARPPIAATAPARPASPPARPAEPPRAGAEPPRLGTEPPRRPGEPPVMPGAPQTAAARREAEMRTLIVGREISLSGEITSCDRLVVEGSVEANLANCRDINIAETGLFKGSASIDDAEVRGRFEGVLNVGHRLLIRASGRVVGTVRYGQIEIECGGQISGDIQAQPNAGSALPPRAGIKTSEAG